MTTDSPPDTAAVSAGELRIIPRRHVGRWLGAVACIAFLGWIAYSFVNAQIHWPTVASYLSHERLIAGLGVAIALTGVAMAIGIALGVVVALMRLIVA